MKNVLLLLSVGFFLISCKKLAQSEVRAHRELLSEPGFEKLAECTLADSAVFSILANGRTIRLVKDGAVGTSDTFELSSVVEDRKAITSPAPDGRLFTNTYIFSGSEADLVLVYADKYTNNGSIRFTFKGDSASVIECSQNFKIDLSILSKSVEAVKTSL